MFLSTTYYVFFNIKYNSISFPMQHTCCFPLVSRVYNIQEDQSRLSSQTTNLEILHMTKC